MKFGEETPAAILGAAVRTLEAEDKEVTEESLLETTRNKGIHRRQVKDFLAKVAHGKKRCYYPGYFKEHSL